MYINPTYQSNIYSLLNVYGQQKTTGSLGLNNNPVYNNMIKSSSKINLLASPALSYVQNIKGGAAGMKSALSSLSSLSSYNVKTPGTTDESSVSIASAGKDFSAGTGTAISVSQIATGQVNTGSELTSKMNSGLYGTQSFEVTMGGKTHSLSFRASSADTNKDAQDKMAAAINSAGIGVQASVESKDGKSSLVIKSTGTGDDSKNIFSIRDVSGGAVKLTGADQVTTQAADAKYTVNGEAKTSASNTVDAGNGISVTLKKATAGDVTLSYGKSSGAAANQVKSLADSYNKAYGAALKNESDSKSNRLFSQLVNTSRTYASSLNKIGIEFDESGYMKVNEDKLAKASEDGSLERFFTQNRGANYGFASRMSQIADNVTRNTSSYVSSQTLGAQLMDYSGIYGNTGSSSQYNSFNSGLLLSLFV